jgi:outer membrane biosynthesis protein TonB
MEASLMKAIRIISTAALSLLLGTAALAYAQQDQDKPAPQDEKAQKDKSTKQEDKNAKQPDKSRAEEKNAQQENKNDINKQEEKNAQQQNKDNNKQNEKNAQQQDRNTMQEVKSAEQDKNNRQEEKNTQQAQRTGGNGGGRIPDDRFRANFGREHSFRVSQSDYSRDRRFQYGGYSFEFVDAWPTNWLYTQDVFVVEIGGVYYLCNPMYPGINIALSIAE